MVMTPYSLSTPSYYETVYSDGPVYISNSIREKNILSDVLSNRQAAPYLGPLYQSYSKAHVAMARGWSHFESNNRVDPIYWTHQEGYRSPPSNFEGVGGITGAQETDSYNNAVSALTESVRGGLDLSIDLAEHSKTLAIGRDCLKVVRSLAKARNPWNIIKAIGDARLVWTYGLKPTVQSIFDSALYESKHYNNETFRYKGRGKSVNVWDNVSYGTGWPDYTYVNSADAYFSVRDEICVDMRIPDTPLTQTARLSSLNPVSIAWELLPFSFVADWFYNVGDYLRDLETAVTYNSYFTQGYRTQTKRINFVLKADRNVYLPYGGSVYQPEQKYSGHWEGRSVHSVKTRVVLYEYPLPKAPVLQANLGSQRLLNLAGLLTLGIQARSPRGARRVFQKQFLPRSQVARKSRAWSLDDRLNL